MKVKVKQPKQVKQEDIDYNEKSLFVFHNDMNYVVLSLGEEEKGTFRGVILSPPFNQPQLMGEVKSFLCGTFKPLEKGASITLKN